MPEHFSDEPGLTRRTVMRTAAWSVPVIAAAVATPMAAASGSGKITDAIAFIRGFDLVDLYLELSPGYEGTYAASAFTFPNAPEVTISSVEVERASFAAPTLYLYCSTGPITSEMILRVDLDGYAPPITSLCSHGHDQRQNALHLRRNEGRSSNKKSQAK